MFMAPIKPVPRRRDYEMVRLMRRWAAARGHGEPQLPSLISLGHQLGLEPQVAIAVASMFQLTEACLGRPLQAECCCSVRLSPDERAVLLMLDAAGSRASFAPAAIPHGLPGALLWAMTSVRKLIGEPACIAVPRPGGCPFIQPNG